MIKQELNKWMEQARVGDADLAKLLTDNGHQVTRQRVWQWRRGDPISETWAAWIEQVMAQVDASDQERLACAAQARAQEGAVAS
jgi:hypothetical protein